MKSKDKEINSDIVELVNGFNKLKGSKLFLEMIKWVFTGMFMGSSDAIPGYSGGTTLALLGFFKRLIFIAKSVFVPEPGLTRMRALVFMLPFGLGWFAGVFVAAEVIKIMLENDLGLELIFFFSAFITFAIPVFLKSEKPNLTRKHKGYKRRWIYVGIGFSIILTFTFLLRYLPHPVGYNGEWTAQEEKNYGDDWAFEWSNWWILAIVAYIGGCVTLIPGGSGAIIQLLSGQYADIHAGLLAHFTGNHGLNLCAVLIYAICTFSGLVTMVFIMSWVLKKHERNLAAASFGMLMASIVAVLIAPEFADYTLLQNWEHIVGVISAWLIGASCAITINLVINNKNKNLFGKNSKKASRH